MTVVHARGTDSKGKWLTLIANAQMEAEIAQQNKIQSSIRQETNLLKKSANELKDQIANLSIALRELQAEERQLSKEVVDSPDRIKIDLAEAASKLERVKEDIASRQQEKDAVMKGMEHTSMAEESVQQGIAEMKEMETRVHEYEIAAEDHDDGNSRLESVERKLDEKEGEKVEKERQLERLGTLD